MYNYLFGQDEIEADEKQKHLKYLMTEQIKKSKIKLISITKEITFHNKKKKFKRRRK